MVKLSDIIRKAGKIKPGDKSPVLSEAAKARERRGDLIESKKIYEDAFLSLKPLMSDIKQGKRVQGRKILDIAESLVEQLRIENENLLLLLNIFSFLGEQDDFLYSHSVNMGILASGLGLTLGYNESDLINLCASTLLHDIGLLKLPTEIIIKPAELTKEEFELVKKHPVEGLALLANIKDPPKFAPEVVYQHHERIDGTGYPEGKRGEDLSEPSQIVAIIEVYETITHPRPYRKKKIIPYEGVKMVIQESRSSFDPKLAKKFLNFMTPYPLGSFVLLNNNEIGRVIHINENQPLRPVVEIFFAPNGKPPENPKRIDLAKSPVLYIEKPIDDSQL